MFINPNNVLRELGIKDNMRVADLGCGSGNWVLPLAKILENGFIFAVDAQQEPLSALESKAVYLGLKNIKTIVADIEKQIPGIQPESCDVVILANILFQVENITSVFQEAKRILKRQGKLLVVDWKIDSSFGPKHNRVAMVRVKEIAKNIGLKLLLDLEQETGAYHYGLVFVRP